MFQPAPMTTRDEKTFDSGGTVEVKPRRRISWWWVAGALVLALLILVGTKAGQFAKMFAAAKTMVPPPESVASAKVQSFDWQPTRSGVGTLIAIRGVTLGAEVTGTVREIGFENGGLVKKGQLIVRLDTSAESAQLQSAIADAGLAKQTLSRAESLRRQEVNTQAELEVAQAKDKQARSAVVNLEAIINKKVIRAPFDGRVGIRQVELGQVVSPGTPIVSLQTVTPIYAEFQLPQQALADVKLGQRVAVTVDVYPGSTWDGEITTINPEIDPATRNVRMRATVQNPDGKLTPGMFASVEVSSGEMRKVLVIPATAVLFAPYGDSVYVLESKKAEDGKEHLVAQQRFIRTGERRGDYVAVASGLAEGETVASSGAFKLRPGMAVVVNNSIAPPAQFVPAPVDR
jgi:membrane fusion protein (multidrug efflux system)